MITTRARGLATLQAGVMTFFVGGFFWVYAGLLYYVPFVHWSPEVNLPLYFLCVVGGMLIVARERLGSSWVHGVSWPAAAQLAGRQIGWMVLLTFTMMFATRDRSISRLFLGSFFVWAWLGLVWLNMYGPRYLARLVFKEQRLPTVLIGRLASLARMEEWIASKKPLGFDAVGFMSDDAGVAEAKLSMPFFGKVDQLARVLEERAVGQVMMLTLPPNDADARQVIEVCQERGCRLLIHSDLEERYMHPLVPVMEDGSHFYTLQQEPLEDPVNRLMKRTLDLAVSVPVVLLVLPPLCLWVWVMQRRQAPGPLFHMRTRRGQQGRPFAMLKFRSMFAAPLTEKAEAQQVTVEDERVFPFGRFLRRRSFDEFPQFINVLRGEMSLVGPRPYMPLLDQEFSQQARAYRTRYLVKPGITGMAQSLGFRGAVLEEEMLRRRLQWDVHYIAHWSIWLDLQITLRTAWQIIFPPKTAY
jgi:exopolysaccharide biosynthesis polyprenyl glycosylphosphotransferase